MKSRGLDDVGKRGKKNNTEAGRQTIHRQIPVATSLGGLCYASNTTMAMKQWG